MATTAPAETKAQRVERLKRERNPWECLDDLRRFAREGFDAIPPEWLGTYFRWWGVYTQGDGGGAVGGRGGEGRMAPYFMVRIRIPGGIVTARQLRAVAELSERHGRGVADLTVRQNIQLHWVAIEALPEVLETLWRCGLTTTGACGDVTRNVTGCPVAGVDADEVCDASPVGLEVNRLLAGNPAYYNLPRKFKITVTGCRVWCSYPEINDIALTAVRRRGEEGFALRVAGGLSTEPYLAAALPVFVGREQALPVVRAIAEIFRDAQPLREHRERARLKHLFVRHGWTPERFLEEMEKRLGFALERARPPAGPDDPYRDHVGIHRQKQPGKLYVGASVLRGRITPRQMRAAADLAERHAAGELRTTIMQNLLILNVPERRAPALADGLAAAGLPVEASPFARGIVACTGTEFCKLAIAETKGFARWLAEELEERIPGFDQDLKLHVTGCPNSCGQHWIADIGLEGKKLKVDGRMVDAYYFFVGGAVGRFAGIARKTGYRCAAAEAPDAIERLLRGYLARRWPGESPRRFFARHSEEEVRALLAGRAVEAEPRDPSAGPTPHGAEG